MSQKQAAQINNTYNYVGYLEKLDTLNNNTIDSLIDVSRHIDSLYNEKVKVEKSLREKTAEISKENYSLNENLTKQKKRSKTYIILALIGGLALGLTL